MSCLIVHKHLGRFVLHRYKVLVAIGIDIDEITGSIHGEWVDPVVVLKLNEAGTVIGKQFSDFVTPVGHVKFEAAIVVNIIQRDTAAELTEFPLIDLNDVVGESQCTGLVLEPGKATGKIITALVVAVVTTSHGRCAGG